MLVQPVDYLLHVIVADFPNATHVTYDLNTQSVNFNVDTIGISMCQKKVTYVTFQTNPVIHMQINEFSMVASQIKLILTYLQKKQRLLQLKYQLERIKHDNSKH